MMGTNSGSLKIKRNSGSDEGHMKLVKNKVALHRHSLEDVLFWGDYTQVLRVTPGFALRNHSMWAEEM